MTENKYELWVTTHTATQLYGSYIQNIAPDNKGYPHLFFSYFSTKTQGVGTLLKCLGMPTTYDAQRTKSTLMHSVDNVSPDHCSHLCSLKCKSHIKGPFSCVVHHMFCGEISKIH